MINTRADRCYGAICLVSGLIGLQTVSTLATSETSQRIYLSLLVIAWTLFFSVVCARGLVKMVTGQKFARARRRLSLISRAALVILSLCLTATFLFPMTVYYDDGGLIGGGSFFTWVFSVQNAIHCPSEGGCCGVGFVYNPMQALNALMFMLVTANVLLAQQWLNSRKMAGFTGLVVMLLVPCAYFACGLFVMLDIYLATALSVLAAISIVVRSIITARSRRYSS